MLIICIKDVKLRLAAPGGGWCGEGSLHPLLPAITRGHYRLRLAASEPEPENNPTFMSCKKFWVKMKSSELWDCQAWGVTKWPRTGHQARLSLNIWQNNPGKVTTGVTWALTRQLALVIRDKLWFIVWWCDFRNIKTHSQVKFKIFKIFSVDKFLKLCWHLLKLILDMY